MDKLHGTHSNHWDTLDHEQKLNKNDNFKFSVLFEALK
jgi:hypothetical protein